jgi:hypothetical protein
MMRTVIVEVAVECDSLGNALDVIEDAIADLMDHQDVDEFYDFKWNIGSIEARERE